MTRLALRVCLPRFVLVSLPAASSPTDAAAFSKRFAASFASASLKSSSHFSLCFAILASPLISSSAQSESFSAYFSLLSFCAISALKSALSLIILSFSASFAAFPAFPKSLPILRALVTLVMRKLPSATCSTTYPVVNPYTNPTWNRLYASGLFSLSSLKTFMPFPFSRTPLNSPHAASPAFPNSDFIPSMKPVIASQNFVMCVMLVITNHIPSITALTSSKAPCPMPYTAPEKAPAHPAPSETIVVVPVSLSVAISRNESCVNTPVAYSLLSTTCLSVVSGFSTSSALMFAALTASVTRYGFSAVSALVTEGVLSACSIMSLASMMFFPFSVSFQIINSVAGVGTQASKSTLSSLNVALKLLFALFGSVPSSLSSSSLLPSPSESPAWLQPHSNLANSVPSTFTVRESQNFLSGQSTFMFLFP